MIGLLYVFSFWAFYWVCLFARSRVWRGIMNYMISKIYPGFGHSKFIIISAEPLPG